MVTINERDIAAIAADDLFDMESQALEAYTKLGPCDAVRRIFESTLYTVQRVVSCEETLAATARLRNDDYHYGIAWNRVIHGTTISRDMESRLQRWF